MNTKVDVNKLPLGVASFDVMREESLVYVDKTDLVADLAKRCAPLLLTRPRRFGKSTLVSTFHELFENGLDKFKGLKIERDRLWDDHTYQVVHLDFSIIKVKREDYSFTRSFFDMLKNRFDGKPHAFVPDRDPIDALNETLSLYPIDSLVLLIDEYDSPLTAVLDDKEEFESRSALLSAFFSFVKSYSGVFRFVFITGIARIFENSIFSDFNNLIDISFNSRFGSITGYTQEDLELYFKEYIENAAVELNKKYPAAGFSYDKVLSEMKKRYAGYCFDEGHKTQVYNTWSVLNFLRNPRRGFRSYWVDTGGAPSLLVDYLYQLSEASKDGTQKADFLDLERTQVADYVSLIQAVTSLDSDNFPLEAVLYQTGYLTIKQENWRHFRIGIPNLEVKQLFARLLLQQLTGTDDLHLRSQFKTAIKRAMQERDFAALRTELNKTISLISDKSMALFRGSMFRDWIRNTLLLLGIDTDENEEQGASKRSELCFSYVDTLFVMELKVTADPAKANELLAEAKEQLKSRKYTLRPGYTEVIALAAVIVHEQADGKNGSKPARPEIAVLEQVAV